MSIIKICDTNCLVSFGAFKYSTCGLGGQKLVAPIFPLPVSHQVGGHSPLASASTLLPLTLIKLILLIINALLLVQLSTLPFHLTVRFQNA